DFAHFFTFPLSYNMSKVGGKSGGKGGAKKTKSKGNGEDVKTTTRKLTTSQEILFKLRGVLFEATGKDRTDFGIPDVLMCKKFGETKISLTLSGAVPRDDKIPIFAMIKNSMEEQYEDSGFGWDDADKKKELGEKGGRFLIARDEAGKEWTQAHDDLLGGGGSVRVEMASDDYGFDLYVKMIGRPNITAPAAPVPAPKPVVATPTPPVPPVTPAKKIEVVTSDSPTGVVDVPPAAAPTENKLGTFDIRTKV
ncbi:hypothetical protein TrRE_jg11699, partial [Triparma retinervis]